MREFYSKGYNASVFLPNSEDKILFPNAQLVRVAETTDRLWFARQFYGVKIANLLFPDNFIDVVGAQNTDKQTPKLGDLNFKTPYTLFSKAAEIDPEHAIYSADMSVNISSGKVSLCECGSCIGHRKFHEQNKLAAKAFEIRNTILKTGIDVPFDDPSDYCINTKGNLVFFEIEEMDSEALKSYLKKIQDPTSDHFRVEKLLERYDYLYQASMQIISDRILESINPATR